MDAFRLSLRYAVRSLIRQPGFAALAVLTLAVGIGVNTVAFTLVNAFLFKPFRWDGARELGWIMVSAPGNRYGQMSLPEFEDLSRAVRTFATVAAQARMPVSLRDADRAEQAWALLVSTNYLPALRVQPAVGRLFANEDLASVEIPAVVSHRFWTTRLGGASIAGRTTRVNGRTVSIVGVLPDDFQGPSGFFEPDLWLPLERLDALAMPAALKAREHSWLGVIGRMKPGVTAAQASEELKNIAAQLARDYPTSKDRTFTFTLVTDGHPEVRALAPAAWIALSIVGLVLLIACFNVTGLLLARAAERRREIAVRTALGASRGRILLQLVTEATLLAALGGIAAVVVAAWTADLLSAFSLPAPIPQRIHFAIDRRLIAFTALLVAVSGILPALVPAWQVTRVGLLQSMKKDAAPGRSRSLTRNAVVVAQIAGSTLFLAAALLFVRSFWASASFNPGFDTANTAVLELNPSLWGYDASRTRALTGALLERISRIPGVERTAVSDRIPFYVGYARTTHISTDGSDCRVAKCRTASYYAVGRDHFAALGIPLKAGRDFTSAEAAGAPVAIVSDTMAALVWPASDAVGQSFRTDEGTLLQVIGIAADVKHRTFREDPAPYFYRPLTDADYRGALTIVVRAGGEPGPLLAAIRDQVHALDANLPAASVKTMAQRMELPLWPQRTAAGFFLICGTLALVLATVGLFGVTYYAVTQRTREFGVRLALGATRQRLIALVLREGLLLAIPGVALGIVAAMIVARLLARALFGVTAADVPTYTVTAALQTLAALAAAALPAYRASRSDPMVALRQE